MKEATELLADVFNRMTYEQKIAVPPETAKRIGALMASNGYKLCFGSWHPQDTRCQTGN